MLPLAAFPSINDVEWCQMSLCSFKSIFGCGVALRSRPQSWRSLRATPNQLTVGYRSRFALREARLDVKLSELALGMG